MYSLFTGSLSALLTFLAERGATRVELAGENLDGSGPGEMQHAGHTRLP